MSRVAAWYVEVMRNIPLLLQLLVWYGLITELLPPIRQSIELGGLVYLNQRGLRIAWPQAHPATCRRRDSINARVRPPSLPWQR